MRITLAEQLLGSADGMRASAVELDERLRQQGVYFGEGLLPTYAYAHLAAGEQVDRWAASAEALVHAADEFATQLLADGSLCDAMGLNSEAVELARIDPGYKRTCVICRPDGIPRGADITFVELNSDSPAMMMFLDIVTKCLLELPAFAPLRAKVTVASSADLLLETLVACYREYGGSGVPTIAIADWEGQKTRFEHRSLAEHFESRGFATVVCDPRAFCRRDGKLEVGERRIDLVYRRALVTEMVERRAEIAPLLDAYRDGSVCMVNPLRSYLASTKSMLSRIGTSKHGPTNGLVPRTLLLDTATARDTVLASPTCWALKKSESHGGLNVVLPGRDNEPAWRDALAASRHEPWIAQEYLEVPRMRIPVLDRGSITWSEKYFNWNPFVFGGRYAGGMVRVSDTPLINITLGGGLIPSWAA